MTFETFRAVLADALHVDPAVVTPEASFVADLGVDSLRFLEILLALDRAGIRVGFEAISQIQTVADAWKYVSAHTDLLARCAKGEDGQDRPQGV